MLTTLIFDLDLTLLDSLQPCLRGVNKLARHFGLPETNEETVLKNIALTTEEFWKAIFGHLDPQWYPYFLKNVQPEVNAETKCFPDALELLKYAKSRQYLMAVATNRENPWLDIASFGIGCYFDTVVGACGDIRPKPEPDIIQEVLKHLNTSPASAIFLGDSRSDMQSSKAAGVRAIGMTQGGVPEDELFQAGATWVMENMTQVKQFLEKDLV
ncbi:MAG: HAD family hydrolase [Deltaproteobacteria bacterium]|jgi:HAD superfamily hydrolase (TIGR01509 family)|nr:HAD family hydrolase [Deltaproteobacteria bacterium]